MGKDNKITQYICWILLVLFCLGLYFIFRFYFQKYCFDIASKNISENSVSKCPSSEKMILNINLDQKYDTIISHFFSYKFNYPSAYYVNEDYDKIDSTHNWESYIIDRLENGTSKGTIYVDLDSDADNKYKNISDYVDAHALGSVGYDGVSGSAYGDKILNKTSYLTKNGIEVIKCDVNETHVISGEKDPNKTDIVFGPFYFLNLTGDDGVLKILSIHKRFSDYDKNDISDEEVNKIVESVELVK